MINHKIKKIINQKGFYCSLDIEAFVLETGGLELVIYEGCKWDVAVRFGVQIFYENFRKINDRGLSIQIDYIHGMPIDTNSLVVAYAVVEALNQLLPAYAACIGIDDNANVYFSK